LAKPSCGSSPLWLQHKIEYKKPLVLIPSIIGPFHNISTCLLVVISRAKTILHITYSCNTRILNFGQQLPMHKLLLYPTDDIGLLLISSQLVLKMMKPWQTPLAQSEHPARGEKKEQRERTQVWAKRTEPKVGCKRGQEQIMFQSLLSQKAVSEMKEKQLTSLCQIFWDLFWNCW
jgi:hypothetical protein